MNFSTDRDLLLLEPNVFRDVPFAAQQRLKRSDAVLAGSTLTSAGADFASAQVDPGSVVLVTGTAYEVLARTSATTLTISLLRASLTDEALPGPAGSNLEVIVRSFEPQASLVHDVLLRMLGTGPRWRAGRG